MVPLSIVTLLPCARSQLLEQPAGPPAVREADPVDAGGHARQDGLHAQAARRADMPPPRGLLSYGHAHCLQVILCCQDHTGGRLMVI